MKNNNNLFWFINQEGYEIEIHFYPVQNPIGNFLVWPCGGGNARSYKIPKKLLLENGYNLILYNPSGHGNSKGYFSFPRAVLDIFQFLKESNISHLSIFGFGHSMGCSGLLLLAEIYKKFQQFIFVSPLLNSITCMNYMYEKNTIGEFIEMLKEPGTNNLVEKIMSEPYWMDIQTWKREKIKEKLNYSINNNRVRLPSVGDFLEKLFIETRDMWELVREYSEIIQIFHARVDNWYPIEDIIRKSKHYNLKREQVEIAYGHFFSGGWNYVINYLKSQILINN